MDAIWPYVAALGYPAIMLAIIWLVFRARRRRDAQAGEDGA